MKFYIIVALVSSLVLGGASHWVRDKWTAYQAGQIETLRQTELLANYENELKLKDLQIEMQEQSITTLEQENKWAVRHVAQREEQIAELREGFSDEVNLCLGVYIDPILAN